MAEKFQIGTDAVSAQEIMQKIQQRAAEKNESDFDFLPDGRIYKRDGDVQHCINVDRRWDICTEFPITSHRRFVGSCLVWLKKHTRGFYKWYVDRLFEQQVEFNHLMWMSYYELKQELERLQEQRGENSCEE